MASTKKTAAPKNLPKSLYRALRLNLVDEVLGVVRRVGIEATNDQNQTALAWAVWCGVSENTVRALLKKGANPNALVDSMGRSCLHYASVYAPNTLMRPLLGHGADLEITSNDGLTPLGTALQYAFIHGPSSIEPLLKKGALCTPKVKLAARDILASCHGESIAKTFAKYGHPLKAKPSKRSVCEVTFDRLWRTLVPELGAASTLQGEMIRIVGRLERELMGNGGCNWDADFEEMHRFWRDTLLSETTLFSQSVLVVIKELARGKSIRNFRVLRARTVEWVLLHPDPVALGKVKYKR